MDKKLAKKASKHGIATRERVEEILVDCCANVKASDLVKSIAAFLNQHNLHDADFDFNVENDYGDWRFKEMLIYAYKEKTEEQITKEIESLKKDREAFKDAEHQLYLKLKKKYEE